MIALALLLCAAPRVVDGDTIACSGVGRVRMVAVDAPDKLSSKPCFEQDLTGRGQNHVCNDELAALASRELTMFVAGKRVTYRLMSYDTRNRRPVAQMFANGHDLQCFMLHQHPVALSNDPDDHVSAAMVYFARYLPQYDKPLTIARRCPATVRKAWR